MAKEYVKLWLSYENYFASYSAAEVGRLVLAMIDYKSQGVEPEFSGSERFIWPAIKHDIDTDNDFAKIKQQNAAKRSKIEQDEARQSKTEQSAQVKVKDNNPLTPLQGESGSVPKSKTFTPPTPEEVNAYCQERKNGIDGTEFVDFYQSKGWLIGKSKMKDWKAAVRTWEKSRKAQSQPEPERRWI